MSGQIFKHDEIEKIRKANFENAVSVGRRQPMHKMHYDSINEILNLAMRLVYVVGSTNSAFTVEGEVDKLFDPIKNPLTFLQQRQQLFFAFPHLYDMERICRERPQVVPEKNVIIISLPDIGNLTKWSKKLCGLLSDYGVLEKSVLHFRGKQIDKGEIEYVSGEKQRQISDSWPTDALRDFGLSIWYSENPKEEDYLIHSSDLRIVNLEEENKNIIAYDYIFDQVKRARENDPDKNKLRKIPLTMFDLTLERMRKEADISSGQIIKEIKKKEFGLTELYKAAYKLIRQR